jgi:hypothetical protein
MKSAMEIFFVLLFAGILSVLPVYFLWNDLVPALFHGPKISLWQAIEIIILGQILVKGAVSKASK